MSAKPKPIPEGYHTATPYLVLSDAAAAIEWYKNVFSAHEHLRLPAPEGRVGHAEIKIGDSILMMADEQPDMCTSPKTLGGTAMSLMLYVEDCDAIVAKAEAAGAKITQPLENKFYGDRACTFFDPWGHMWTVATHVEDVPPDELERRIATLYGAPPSRALIPHRALWSA